MVALGGLHILATERHEARRIDNQLRGRAGRQGDPGSSRFYLSLEDDLMRIFGSDRISGLMLKLGMEEGVPIEHGMVTKSIERAQRQVEAQNFAVRKHLLEYDDVMNKQRKAVYDMRRMILEGKDARDYVLNLSKRGPRLVPRQLRRARARTRTSGTWRACSSPSRRPTASTSRSTSWRRWGAARWRRPSPPRVRAQYEEKERQIGPELMLFHERMIMLQIVDTQWKDHLYALDHLKEGIGLRGYGQRDPLVEYKKESFNMFQALMDRIDEEILRWVFLYQPVPRRRTSGAGRRRGPTSRPGRAARRPRPAAARAAGPRARARAGAGAGRARGRCPRNLTFNDPGELLSGSRSALGAARAEGSAGRHRRGADGAARGQEGRPQRPLSLRQRQEVQEVPRGVGGA